MQVFLNDVYMKDYIKNTGMYLRKRNLSLLNNEYEKKNSGEALFSDCVV